MQPHLTSLAIARSRPNGSGVVGFGHDGAAVALAQRTVLFGPNGAGKSWMIEGLWDVARGAKGRQASAVLVGGLSFGETKYVSAVAPGSGVVAEQVWTGGKLRWTTTIGKAASLDGREVVLGSSASVIGSPIELPPDVAWLRKWFRGVRFVGSGVPRCGPARPQAYLFRPPDGGSWESQLEPWEDAQQRVANVAMAVAAWFEHDGGVARSVLSRLGLPDDVRLHEMGAEPNGDVRAWVSLGGVEIGSLSDGTLRVLEIVAALLDPTTSLLLLEEPETSLHPALLARLLAEIDAHRDRFQLLLSTQSPQVVSWARPDELRLVHWDATTRQPSVRPLAGDEVARAEAFLTDEGSLGEWVVGGGLDGGA